MCVLYMHQVCVLYMLQVQHDVAAGLEQLLAVLGVHGAACKGVGWASGVHGAACKG